MLPLYIIAVVASLAWLLYRMLKDCFSGGPIRGPFSTYGLISYAPAFVVFAVGFGIKLTYDL